MHKISLIAFLLFFSFLAQARPSFGDNCTNDILDTPLTQVNPPFPLLNCFLCQTEWDNYGIPEHDDILEEKGWTKKQVALVVHTLNIDNKFNNEDEDKRAESLYDKILEELKEKPPLSNLEDIITFIQSMKDSSRVISEKLSYITQENLTAQFQEICKPRIEEVSETPNNDETAPPKKCCKLTESSTPYDCPSEINNSIERQAQEFEVTKGKCLYCPNDPPTLQPPDNYSESNTRSAWKIEMEINMCNPAVCCNRSATEPKRPRYDSTTQDCKAEERPATDEEDNEEKCQVTQEEQEETGDTEAGADCVDCEGNESPPTPPSTTEQAEEIVQALEEAQEKLEKAREEIEDLKAQREENDREYDEKREERDRDNTALAEDLSDCQNKEGDWSKLSKTNQRICGLLARIHQRQDEIAKMQDYNQQVQQQLWQAVQSQSMNAFSQYESIHKMMRPGFFNSPYPGQNLQIMDQINTMKANISSLQNSMDQQGLASRFDQLVSRMDQMIQLNATGVYNNDSYYRNFRQDLLGVQQAIPNQPQNPVPTLR